MSVTKGASIVGHGYRLQGPNEGEAKSGIQMIAGAARDAMVDAGIEKYQVGAVFTPRSSAGDRVFQYNMKVINELKIMPLLTSEITSHGAGSLSMLFHAANAVNSGYVDYALCIAGDTGRRGSTNPRQNAATEADPYFELPLGPSTPSLYAQVASRYMHESGATRRDFAKAAVAQREWGIRHPYAAMKDKGSLTIEDVLNSRAIATPLHLLDCSRFFGGGSASAFVVTRADLAKASPSPIRILGFGEASTHEFVTDRLGLDDPRLANERRLTDLGAIVAAQTAFAQAGLKHSDIDMVQTSVPFSFAMALIMECLGFCERGEGGAFLSDGGIDFGTGMPVNTNGGMLSFGQSGVACIADMISEGVMQLRHNAMGLQVDDAKTAVLHGHGGILGCHAVMIVSNDESVGA